MEELVKILEEFSDPYLNKKFSAETRLTILKTEVKILSAMLEKTTPEWEDEKLVNISTQLVGIEQAFDFWRTQAEEEL